MADSREHVWELRHHEAMDRDWPTCVHCGDVRHQFDGANGDCPGPAAQTVTREVAA